jgi:hypothetical protein
MTSADEAWKASTGFTLRWETADWLSAFGAILLAVSIFSTVIGPIGGDGFRYFEWWPLGAYAVLAMAAGAFFLSRFLRYRAICVIAICCFVMNGLVFFSLVLEVMPIADPNRLDYLQRTYNITKTDATYLGIELKDGIFFAFLGNFALFAAGKLGRTREECFRPI